jgi:secretion/DNA translocation related CpaE-like protein
VCERELIVAETLLILTRDACLLDDLLRLCAAAGAEAEVVPPPDGRPRTDQAPEALTASWERAGLVLVGDDWVREPTHEGASGVRPPGGIRRPGVLLIGRDLDDPGVWERGVRIGAEGVVVLPDAETWLTGRIADAAEGTGSPALTVGVLGGRGGAGASTLACALAVTAARAGQRTVLVDGDPLGGGLDVLFGAERVEGLRWPAFAESRGRVGGTALEESLPRSHDVHLLSWDRADSVSISADAMRSVLGAARRRGGIVVVDLPRHVDQAATEALAQLDLGLLLVPAELRTVAAAHRVAARASMLLQDLRLVVRPPGGTPGGRRPYAPGLDVPETARLLGLPLAGELSWESGLLDEIARGRPPGFQPRGGLARFCSGFWDRCLAGRVSGGGVRA